MWDESFVVAANNKGTCYVWRLFRGTQLQAHDGYILKCLLSPEFCEPQQLDFRVVPFLCCLDFGVIKVVLFWVEKGHQRWVLDCVFSVDGAYLITASSDTTARLWSMSTGEDIRVYQCHHKATVCAVLFMTLLKPLLPELMLGVILGFGCKLITI
ncbi:hypothetical protein L2E82_10260 [Cichorium intybus]|uniref:Uncharacterized protein n=1 Tax=Cichorium intybus TaxID=13427 RepID=A0ACB9GA52_CICIN|nr:hypothetical protein L2E82_10260 [Cichorium intybus]